MFQLLHMSLIISGVGCVNDIKDTNTSMQCHFHFTASESAVSECVHHFISEELSER